MLSANKILTDSSVHTRRVRDGESPPSSYRILPMQRKKIIQRIREIMEEVDDRGAATYHTRFNQAATLEPKNTLEEVKDANAGVQGADNIQVDNKE